MWWKALLFIWIAVFSAIGIVTPIAGNFTDLAMVNGMDSSRELPVLIQPQRAGTAVTENGSFLFRATDKNGREAEVILPQRPDDFDAAQSYVISARYDDAKRLAASRILDSDPSLTFPFIPGLEERARIIFFHVPMAWMTVIAFLVSMWFGIKYLRTKDLDNDIRSSVSAGLGLLFCILATTTGSLWAKFNWGSFWNWDPRETSIFVLLLVYGAYFALRSALESDEKRATLSAVYSILAFVTVPFFIFVVPRIMPGLHPGSADDVNAGPVVSTGGMNAVMRVVLYSMLLGFIVLYAWMMSLHTRIQRLLVRQSSPA